MIKIFVTKPSEKEHFINAMYTMEECPFTGYVPHCNDKSCTDCFEHFIEWHITFKNGYWVCPRCSFRNDPRYDFCQNCSEDKPEGAEIET